MALFWRKHRKRRIRKNQGEKSALRNVAWGIGIFVLIAAVVYGIWHVTRLPSLTLQEVTIEGGETVSHEELRSIVDRELTGTYFLLVPHRFAFLYPEERIHDALSSVARVHNVSLERVDRTTLYITFDEYVPFALLCESGFETATCYFLDDTGYVFSQAPALRGGSFVRHVIEGRAADTNMQAFPSEFLTSMQGFIDALEAEFGFRVRLVTHQESGDITYHLNEGGRLFTAQKMNMQEVFENLQSVLASNAFEHLEPGNFNYIDLRFGNKVFVNEELDVATTTEEVADAPFEIE